ncbi:SMP-30/gluconolactonase/LRE family protein [Erythrobacter sp. W53]|uniref:SMP-30/gluconolactonase/LRE family protein n=1 Tax=Erythrobacter sp. W53 TaxID=3425947 RepID=UPI003D766D43
MTKTNYPTLGKIERFSNALDSLIDADELIVQLADGFKWTEGPAWDARRGRLLFSDIPNNRIHSWNDTAGLGVLLDPAGNPHGEDDLHAAPGTNGLFYESASDSILICNQDARSVDRYALESGEREAIAIRFQGKKYNSPNDVIRSADGSIWFTDPPYGLKDGDGSAGRELDVKCVYRLSADGKLDQLIADMTFPNGLALSPDEKHLYVSQSDPEAPVLRRFTIKDDGSVSGGEVWLDTKSELNEDNPGLPDGMALDTDGNVWATGPGGVWVTAPDGEALGRIHTGKATANCAFGDDGSTLYMTATDKLLRVKTRAKGIFFA